MPALLVKIEEANGDRNGDHDSTRCIPTITHGLETKNIVHLILEPVDQFGVGGVALVEQDRA